MPKGRQKGCRIAHTPFSDTEPAAPYERTHTGEKPYACSMCPEQFSRKSAVKITRRETHPLVSSLWRFWWKHEIPRRHLDGDASLYGGPVQRQGGNRRRPGVSTTFSNKRPFGRAGRGGGSSSTGSGVLAGSYHPIHLYGGPVQRQGGNRRRPEVSGLGPF